MNVNEGLSLQEALRALNEDVSAEENDMLEAFTTGGQEIEGDFSADDRTFIDDEGIAHPVNDAGEVIADEILDTPVDDADEEGSEERYAVSVDFGGKEIVEYDEDNFTSLEEAKNYCKKLLDVDEIAFEENVDEDRIYYLGNKGQVFFTIYKN